MEESVGQKATPAGGMTPCPWCGEATGELLVPGARGALAHPESP